ncbi:MAG: APC family permease [Acidobacteria bacterium]|nr:APC family permease [Acidobacteriota bacterium]
MAGTLQPDKLERGLGLKEATALNMIDMVGIGPFVVIPLVIKAMGGPQCLLAWLVGALLALLDGFVWAELGAAMPQAGGSYVFLREAYGPGRWGRMMSFLFVWQTLIQAPLVMASGAIGFAQYFTYLVPLGRFGQKAVSGGLILLLLFLLYRRITTIGKISLLLWVGVVGTIGWLIWGGVTHFDARLAFTYPPGAWDLSWVFFAGLGAATVNTIYTYWGYYNVCHLGGEIKQPERNIPRGIFLSILGIGALYLAMQTSILGVLPWRQAAESPFIVSAFFERLYGPGAAGLATLLILWVAFASLFSVILGYSRVPYAAAVDGNFFSVFARVHPTKRFPHISLLTLGAAGLVFSLLFRLSDVIKAILAMRLLVQFMGQAVGVIILRRRWPPERLPFKMWLYPLPALVTIAGWAALFVATGSFDLLGLRIPFAAAGILIILVGVSVYFLRARILKEWPFAEAAQ